MVRQVVFVSLDNVESADARTEEIEKACNFDWLAEYRLVSTTLYASSGANGIYLFFEKD